MLARRVLLVNDGEVMLRALEVVRNRVIDLIVSDNHFPEGQGTRLVREIARLSPRTACLLITSGVIKRED